MCATRKGMKRGLGGVYMQCCTLQCIHVPMPSWSYAQLCNWALIKFQLLKVKILFTSITDICFSWIKRQCRSPVMSSTSKMVFFFVFSALPWWGVNVTSLSVGLTDMIFVQIYTAGFSGQKICSVLKTGGGGRGNPPDSPLFFTIKISAKVGEG